MLNDYLADYIISGQLNFYPYAKKFTKNGIEFVNGLSKEFDVVVYATGYRPDFPFIEKSIFCGKFSNETMFIENYSEPPKMIQLLKILKFQ